MINFRLFTALLPAVALLAGCTADGPAGEGNGTGTKQADIRFEISLAPITRVTTDAALNSAWQDGDRIGIFAVRRAANTQASLESAGNFIHNVPLTYSEAAPGDASTGSWSLDGGTRLWWPNNGDVLDFYAYYPYNDNNGTPEGLDPRSLTFSVETDQNGTTGKGGVEVSNYDLSELLASRADNGGSGYPKGTKVVKLQFSHAMAMVHVDFDLSIYYISPDASVRLEECIAAGTLDIGAAGGPAFTADDAASATQIIMRRVEKEGDQNYTASSTYVALVPPQILDAGTSMFRVVEPTLGAFMSEAITGDLTLAGGRAETFSQAARYEDYALLIPDPVFRTYCLSTFDKDEGNNDGKLSLDEVLAVTSIRVGNGYFDFKIKSLEGIKYFRNLEELFCYGNSLDELDVTGLTNLGDLRCNSNSLNKLDLRGLTKLYLLFCDSNSLDELDVSSLTGMNVLYCNHNTITKLDVTNLTDIQELYCDNNSLKELDVRGLTHLSVLFCHDNPLDNLYVSGLRSLQELYCQNNYLGELDVRDLTNLKRLYCYNNFLTSLDVSGLENLHILSCGNGANDIDLTVYVKLGMFGKIDVTGYGPGVHGSITSLDVKTNTVTVTEK